VQAAALASGALPVFWLARKHLRDERAAAALALAYLLLPPVQWLTASDFHAVSLACPLLLFAWWHLDEGRLWAFAPLAGAAMLTKEHVGLAVAGLGIWYALARGERRRGIAIAVAATAVAVVAALVVVPHFAPAGDSAFESRYEDPALGGRDAEYLLSLLWPLGFVPLAAPLALLAALPELALNVLSSTETQTSVRTHYAAVTVPALLAAAVFGAARLGRRAAYAVLGAALAGTIALGPLGRVELRADGHDEAARRALAYVPDDAAVSATNALGAHLSARERVFSFPVLEEAEWAVVDTTRLTYRDSLDGRRSIPVLAQLRREWETVYAEDGILVLSKRDRLGQEVGAEP
jgi:uncharacterized membrane protein